MAALLMALFLAAAAAWGFSARCRLESDPEKIGKKSSRCTALAEPFLLPCFLLMVLGMWIALEGIREGAWSVFSFCLPLFLEIAVYYALLLCVLPLLRRFFSARACATLWLLPTLLYTLGNFQVFCLPPLLTLTLPRRWLGILGLVWGVGFALILLGQVVSHLRYRHFLLGQAEPVENWRICSWWENEQKRRGAKGGIPVLVSPHTRTPLTIGCFSTTMRLVLPHTRYTEEEFRLIFQHEMRHIQRADTRTKAFLGFCTAVLWFNPLMWLARRKVSDDLELSCDELVLTGADENTRKQYAALLLTTADSGRGYTTCLSAAASSLRYRLRHIVKPRLRFSGSLLVGLVLFVLILGGGAVALADSPTTVQAAVFDRAPAGLVIDEITVNSWNEKIPNYRSVYGWEEETLTAYLASLAVRQVYVGSYEKQDLRQLYVDYGELENGEVKSLTRLELCGRRLFVNLPYDAEGWLVFLLEEEIDWDRVAACLDFDAEDPDPAPQPPDMLLYFNQEINGDGKLMYATKTVLRQTQGGEEQEISPWLQESGTGGVFGYPATQVRLSFTYAPEGDYTVVVENWERTRSYSLSGSQLTGGLLPLAPYSAHYTVCGTFHTVRDTVYEMEFTFDVGLP